MTAVRGRRSLRRGLREAGYDDIHVVPPRGAFVARLEWMAPDVVLMDLAIRAAIRSRKCWW